MGYISLFRVISVFVILTRGSFIIVFLTLIYTGFGWCDNGGNHSKNYAARNLSQSEFSKIASYALTRGDDEQRELVGLTLRVMIDAYSQVLHDSSSSIPRSRATRKKQITWGWATSRVIASLNNDLRMIESGVPFKLFVDHLRQVIFILDGRIIMATGPHTAGQSYFEQRVVEYFCLTRDCSWLNPIPDKSEVEIAVSRKLSNGVWSFQKESKPIFVIGEMLFFEFANYSDRNNKAGLSYRITDEIERLIVMLSKARETGLFINWPLLLQFQPGAENSTIEIIQDNSNYNVDLSLLSRLSSEDWNRVVAWLKNDGLKAGTKLNIKHLMHLL